MPTYYEIEILYSTDIDAIKRLGELGFQVVSSSPASVPYDHYGEPGQFYTIVIMQRERSLPEHGKLRDNYYASIATDAPPPMHFAAPPIRGGE
jgi:hypothetical protein